MSASEWMTLAALVLSIFGASLGVIWKMMIGRMGAGETDCKQRIDSANAQTSQLRADFNDHRIHVADQYHRKSELREILDAALQPIQRQLSDLKDMLRAHDRQ